LRACSNSWADGTRLSQNWINCSERTGFAEFRFWNIQPMLRAWWVSLSWGMSPVSTSRIFITIWDLHGRHKSVFVCCWILGYRQCLWIPGDEDGGGMSSFVVFSMMGFYPVTPGIPVYNMESPVFDQVSIRLPDGKTFAVIARNNSQANVYIQRAALNGKLLQKPWLTHNDILGGGTLELTMGHGRTDSGVGKRKTLLLQQWIISPVRNRQRATDVKKERRDLSGTWKWSGRKEGTALNHWRRLLRSGPWIPGARWKCLCRWNCTVRYRDWDSSRIRIWGSIRSRPVG